MLLQLKHYLSSHCICTIADISNHFNKTPETIEGMLFHLICKGVVVCEGLSCQKHCISCASEQLIICRWQEAVSQSDLIRMNQI